MSDKSTLPSVVVGAEGLALNTQAVASQISAVEKSSINAMESVRREMTLERLAIEKDILSIRQQIDLEKESIRRELAQMVKMQETDSFEHWRAHDALHLAQDRSDDAANEAVEKRLGILNNDKTQIRDILTTVATRESVDVALTSSNRNIESEKADTRRRFETLEAKFYELEKDLSQEIRKEVRPGQDMKVGQGAIVAAVLFLITLLGGLVVVMNLVSP